jgi:hypothetical protein
MSDKKWTRRAAIGFIGAGTGLFATDTAGFTQIEGTRSVSLDKKDDPNGLVGFGPGDRNDIAVSGQDGDRVDLFDLTNNFENGEPMYVSEIKVKNTDGAFSINNLKPERKFSVNGENGAVTVTGVLDLDGNESAEGAAEFQISVNQNGTVVELDRTVTVTVQAEEFYSNPDNYSDSRENGEGKADQPEPSEAKGVVENAANIGRNNDEVATVEQSEQGGGSVSIRIGFKLRPVDSVDCYTLTVKTGEDAGGGNLRAYIVNNSGTELTDRERIKGGKEYSFEIDDTNNDITSANSLFLIFQGKGNQTHDIKFIELKSECST